VNLKHIRSIRSANIWFVLLLYLSIKTVARIPLKGAKNDDAVTIAK
jgi:hypothetical protein